MKPNAAARVIQARWRAYESQLSPEEDMISLQRYPRRYAVTLNSKDYNARQLAKGPVTRVPHTRRPLTQAELALVQSKVRVLKDRILAILQLMQHPALCSESHLRVEHDYLGTVIVEVRSTGGGAFRVGDRAVQTAEEAALLVMLALEQHQRAKVFANLCCLMTGGVPPRTLLNLFDAAWDIGPGELYLDYLGYRSIHRAAPGRYEMDGMRNVTQLDRQDLLACLQDARMRSASLEFQEVRQ